jgi:hypothetical protein
VCRIVRLFGLRHWQIRPKNIHIPCQKGLLSFRFRLEAEEWSDPEDRDEYIAENVFFVPRIARWEHIRDQANLSTIGQTLDEAMKNIHIPCQKGLLSFRFRLLVRCLK